MMQRGLSACIVWIEFLKNVFIVKNLWVIRFSLKVYFYCLKTITKSKKSQLIYLHAPTALQK
ncbi:MAG: hypothetical protein ACD_35C00241G0001 [uncultured bacterium]|nr:MAG: hypothetical protein ACD_35C00241G0001 [uncultured bacterium]